MLLEKVLQCSNGFNVPSPIQSHAWPLLLDSRDLIGIAKTGSAVNPSNNVTVSLGSKLLIVLSLYLYCLYTIILLLPNRRNHEFFQLSRKLWERLSLGGKLLRLRFCADFRKGNHGARKSRNELGDVRTKIAIHRHHIAIGLNNSEVQLWDTTVNRQF
ncbi:hypothetical protein Sjap_023758 [Stephania japonica]|uniref:RNA helicase n=1 Tax=Stephania japonica TaxID=461633 RepID=A0AAP0EC63_9MAGN